jgi:hypothetical protein
MLTNAKLRTCLSMYASGALPLFGGAVLNCFPPKRPVLSATAEGQQLVVIGGTASSLADCCQQLHVIMCSFILVLFSNRQLHHSL